VEKNCVNMRVLKEPPSILDTYMNLYVQGDPRELIKTMLLSHGLESNLKAETGFLSFIRYDKARTHVLSLMRAFTTRVRTFMHGSL